MKCPFLPGERKTHQKGKEVYFAKKTIISWEIPPWKKKFRLTAEAQKISFTHQETVTVASEAVF